MAYRREREATAHLEPVDPGGDDQVEVGEAEELEVARLQTDRAEMVGAVPVEDALGAPGVGDADVGGRGERAQALDGAVAHDAGAGEDDAAGVGVGQQRAEEGVREGDGPHTVIVARRVGSRLTGRQIASAIALTACLPDPWPPR